MLGFPPIPIVILKCATGLANVPIWATAPANASPLICFYPALAIGAVPLSPPFFVFDWGMSVRTIFDVLLRVAPGFNLLLKIRITGQLTFRNLIAASGLR